ncbi:hypothetical protein MED297_08131 [Reinekea sp. MED297]|uniref:Solute-binding protein family 3/N-terminal domain-containing protein n=2 Tax=Reinekea TaxID=230494 RepID=A4BCV9_9GAMM|nr:hypothetical protein MED297_08131 [Reinekea sp. MED297] [Reinekea blandensis MED297]
MLLTSGVTLAEVIQLGTNEDPPYQMVTDGGLTGLVTELMTCGLDHVGAEWQMNLYPWRRLLMDLSNNELDIVFSLDDGMFGDNGFLSSVPLVLEKWFWYSQSGGQPELGDSIAVVVESNQSRWLSEQGYWNLFSVYSLEAALKSLIAGRVEYVLADAGSAKVLLNKSLVNHQLEAEFYRFSTLSAYFSPEFSSTKGDLISELDEALLDCEPVGMILDSETLGRSEALTARLSHLSAFAGEVDRLQSVDAVSENLAELDEDWKQSVDNGQQTPLMKAVLNNALSVQLKALNEKEGGLITEILLTDRFGQLVATSQLTSDYYQGDEAIVISVLEAHQPYISPLYYDRSTEQFQVQISLPRFHDNRLLGVLVFGVDVQRLFQLTD